jgi:hypothetical protein
MHCVKCGKVVPESAGFCPACGEPTSAISTQPVPPPVAQATVSSQKKGPGCLKIGLGIIAVLIVLGVIGSLLPKPPANQKAAASNGTVAAGSADELPVAVTVKELFNAYQANEASAQSYFGKRKLLVSGTVDKVALDFMDNPEVLLKTPNQFMSAHAALAADAKDQAGQYSPGDSLKLICEDVSELASIPMLKECRSAAKDQKSQPIQWSHK